MLNIPFYKNAKDGSHCVQACLKSILKFYFPDKNYSFRYLDKQTNHQNNTVTWDSAMLLFLSKLNFEIIYITNFDYQKFAEKGEKYLESFWTDEVYQYQKQYSNFEKEQKLAKKLIKNKDIRILKRSAKLSDLKTLFSKGYLIMIPINPFILENKKWFGNHMVLITGITKQFIYFHDSGLPPYKNRKTTLEKFWKAASNNNSRSVDLIAVKR